MGQRIQELAQSGKLVLTDGLQHSSKGARVACAVRQVHEPAGFTPEARQAAG